MTQPQIDQHLGELHRRTTGIEQMPPLARHVVDTEGADLVDAWIRGIASCP